ncbi:MAG TPA: hypothetical protein VGK73_07925, partial [Polyangiaceae bacterium]
CEDSVAYLEAALGLCEEEGGTLARIEFVDACDDGTSFQGALSECCVPVGGTGGAGGSGAGGASSGGSGAAGGFEAEGGESSE